MIKTRTYVQNTARVWRFFRCPRSAPAPRGQDEGNSQTWWGRTPHGRAKIQNTENRGWTKISQGIWADFGIMFFFLLCSCYQVSHLGRQLDNGRISFAVKANTLMWMVCLKEIAKELKALVRIWALNWIKVKSLLWALVCAENTAARNWFIDHWSKRRFITSHSVIFQANLSNICFWNVHSAFFLCYLW